MGSVKRDPKRRHGRRTPKRAARALTSELGEKVWAVIGDHGVTGNLTHAQALSVSKKTGGYVTTNEAILNCD